MLVLFNETIYLIFLVDCHMKEWLTTAYLYQNTRRYRPIHPIIPVCSTLKILRLLSKDNSDSWSAALFIYLTQTQHSDLSYYYNYNFASCFIWV